MQIELTYDSSIGDRNLQPDRLGRFGRRRQSLLHQETFEHGLQHAARIIPAIDDLCRQAQVEAKDIQEVYVSAGPGSFTGLRIGITLAKTMAFATDARIVAVPSVRALVENAPDDAQRVIIVLDAKRDQIFTAAFERIISPSPGTPGEWKEMRAPTRRTSQPRGIMVPATSRCPFKGENAHRNADSRAPTRPPPRRRHPLSRQIHPRATMQASSSPTQPDGAHTAEATAKIGWAMARASRQLRRCDEAHARSTSAAPRPKRSTLPKCKSPSDLLPPKVAPRMYMRGFALNQQYPSTKSDHQTGDS